MQKKPISYRSLLYTQKHPLLPFRLRCSIVSIRGLRPIRPLFKAKLSSFQHDDMKNIVDGLTSIANVIDSLTSTPRLIDTITVGTEIAAFLKNFGWPWKKGYLKIAWIFK